jgi:hypothetical protein
MLKVCLFVCLSKPIRNEIFNFKVFRYFDETLLFPVLNERVYRRKYTGEIFKIVCLFVCPSSFKPIKNELFYFKPFRSFDRTLL